MVQAQHTTVTEGMGYSVLISLFFSFIFGFLTFITPTSENLATHQLTLRGLVYPENWLEHTLGLEIIGD